MLVTNSRLKETLLKVYSAPLQGTDLTSAHYCHTKKTYYLCSGCSKGRIQLLTVITVNATLSLAFFFFAAPTERCSDNFLFIDVNDSCKSPKNKKIKKNPKDTAIIGLWCKQITK